jgi:PAS domain S-box-containing protein
LDPNVTGASAPLPSGDPGTPGRETHERNAALERGHLRPAQPTGRRDDDALARLPAHKLFAALAENVRDYAVFLMDARGVIQYWGEGARLMKWWTRQQVVGAHLRVLYLDGGSEDGTAEAHLQQAAERGEYTGEGQRVRADGSTFWAGVTLTALRDDDGGLLGFSKVTRDFSARRAVEAALRAGQAAEEGQRVAEEANRLKSLFVASISHEIRAPLNAMMGYLQMLERESAGRDRQRALVARIQRSSGHLMQVVNDLLDVTRLEAGKLPVSSAGARLGGAVQAALADVGPQAASKGVTISNAVSGSAADTPYWGDEARVRQILVNLLSNAVKFTEAGGHVKVSGGTAEHPGAAELIGPGPWVYVRVEDTGRGISYDRLGAIFEPFEQGRPSDAQRGTGLGLSISRRLARLMAGDLTARSEEGAGSEFVLWLPIAASGSVPR